MGPSPSKWISNKIFGYIILSQIVLLQWPGLIFHICCHWYLRAEFSTVQQTVSLHWLCLTINTRTNLDSNLGRCTPRKLETAASTNLGFQWKTCCFFFWMPVRTEDRLSVAYPSCFSLEFPPFSPVVLQLRLYFQDVHCAMWLTARFLSFSGEEVESK